MVNDRRYRRRNRRPRKPLRRLAKRALRRKAAGAQASQIATLARHVSTLKHTVNTELKLPVIYQHNFQAALRSTNQFLYPIIIPLTSGVSQAGTSASAIGQLPTTNLALNSTVNGPALEWQPIFQGKEMKPGGSNAAVSSVPPWAKLFRQSCTLKFYAGTLAQPNNITVSVVRVNSKNTTITNLKGIGRRLDGAGLFGPQPNAANAATFISPGADYAGSDGMTFPPTSIPTTPALPTLNTDGKDNIMWNKELYTVEYQKSFTLGAANNPQRVPPGGPPYGVEDPTAYAPSQAFPKNNQFMETCKFSVNYGGLKLSAIPPADGNSTILNPQEVTSMRYDNIPIEHKRFLVIHQSYPQQETSAYAPYMQYSSIISAQVPV